MKIYPNKLSLLITLCCVLGNSQIFAQKNAKAPDWQLAVQTYSFRLFTFAEALKKADSIGIKYVQAFPGQKIGVGIEGTMDYHMSASKRDSVLALAKKKGITIVSYGVVTARSESDWRAIFDFAKGMGLKQFASEPEPEFIPLVSKLADEYKINVAFHDHPRPSRYWHPDTLIKYTAGYSIRLGSCADIGHWVRSGLDPVEMLKKLRGRVLELHMKDLHEKPSEEYAAFLLSRPPAGTGNQNRQPGSGAQPASQPQQKRPQMPAGPHDVIWGTGVSNVKGVLKELKAQNFKGPIIAEYEYDWNNNAPAIAESFRYVKDVINKMK